MLFCGGSSSRLSSVARGLSDAARCLFLLHGLCMGLFGLQRVLCGPLWRVFVLLLGKLPVSFRLVASCIHAKHKKIVARSGFSPFLVLDLPFFSGFWGRFSAHCGAFGVASSGSPALQFCPVSWVSCAAGGSDRLGLGFLIGAPSGLASARVVGCPSLLRALQIWVFLWLLRALENRPARGRLVLSIHLVAALFSALFGLFLFGCACRWLAGEIFMLPCVCYDCVPVACTFETL